MRQGAETRTGLEASRDDVDPVDCGAAEIRMAKFVATAAIDELDTGCLGRLYAMPFFLNFAGPAP